MIANLKMGNIFEIDIFFSTRSLNKIQCLSIPTTAANDIFSMGIFNLNVIILKVMALYHY